MNDIVSKIKEKPGFRMIAGVENEKINKAEKELDVKFASEYRAYLSEFGVASFNGHELTGICNSKRLNVVDVTKEEKEIFPVGTEKLYVIERLNLDGIVIWQSSSGEIYQSIPNHKITKIAASLKEYIQ